MCVETEMNLIKQEMFNRSKLGRAVHGMLTHARVNRRLICGLLPAVAYLEKSPEDVLFCVLPQTRPGDSTMHMQTVLLQAFCYENDIPVIQVDSSDKLSEYCGVQNTKSGCSCAVVTKDLSLPPTPEDEFPMSPTEQILADFYEFTLEEYPRPVIPLPS
ncbi:unnamed protein product [Psylliodes chrysocephalus]|uniref:Ribosomal protein eL8/eL30/eS12/Gadd45 domain-containing protein n=1 Tax=Psylliodes chrysocephalus TaxID=3402493 RepID=A0A9P0GHR4_9CUCU|nr:unnamed protein product [Psylliodes chrysocephala]